MNGQIFISYRRDDSRWFVKNIHTSLTRDFHKDQIFMDVDNILPSDDFVDKIQNALSKCRVMIVVIGKHWLDITRNHQRMLDDPSDFVRVEISTALTRNINIIPVLIDNASMPNPATLPDDLKFLSRKQAVVVSDDRFNTDVERLVKAIKSILNEIEIRSKEDKKNKEELIRAKKAEEDRQRKAEEQFRIQQAEEVKKRRIEEQAKQAKREEENKRIIEEEAKIKQNIEAKITTFRDELSKTQDHPETTIDAERKERKETFWTILILCLIPTVYATIYSSVNGFDNFWNQLIGAFVGLGLLIFLITAIFQK